MLDQVDWSKYNAKSYITGTQNGTAIRKMDAESIQQSGTRQFSGTVTSIGNTTVIGINYNGIAATAYAWYITTTGVSLSDNSSSVAPGGYTYTFYYN